MKLKVAGITLKWLQNGMGEKRRVEELRWVIFIQFLFHS